MPLVRVGWAVGPHGVQGDLKFAYTTDHPEWIRDRDTYLLSDPRSGELLTLQIERVRLLPDSFLVRLAGYDTPEPLLGFRGWELGYLAARGELPRDDPNEVFLFELPGLEVRRPDGTVLGRVSDVLDTAAHTLIELDLPSGPLVPFIPQHCPEVHLAEGYIVCTYPLP